MSQDSISSEERELLHSVESTSAMEPLPTPIVWTDSQEQLLNQYSTYYEKMKVLVEDIKSNGPTGKMPKMPTKPKERLTDVFGRRKPRKEVMGPHQLHKYLCENIADIGHQITRETFSNEHLFGQYNEEEIVERLNKGVRNMRRQEAQTLFCYIQFGRFLNVAKAWLEKERNEGRIQLSWRVWLKDKTGYSDDHARKLRVIADTLSGYDKFFSVGLPVSFIISKLKDIKIMLQIPDYDHFWKQPVIFTKDLQPSQETNVI